MLLLLLLMLVVQGYMNIILGYQYG